MYIVELGTDYISGDDGDQKREALWQEVGAWVREQGIQFPDRINSKMFEPAKPGSTWVHHNGNVIVDAAQLVRLMLWEGVTVKMIADLTPNKDNAKAFEDAAARGIPTGPGNQYNSKVEVHMPGQALSTYNETMLLEDSCTDALQTALDKGWRIIAACPQPDSRRPDYILGRFNPERGVGGHGAERGDSLRRIRVSDHVSIRSDVVRAPDPSPEQVKFVDEAYPKTVAEFFDGTENAVKAAPEVTVEGTLTIGVPTHGPVPESGTDAPAVAPRPYLSGDTTPTPSDDGYNLPF